MTKEELDERIARLEAAAGDLGYSERSELRGLKIELEGRRLDDVVAALAGISGDDVARMDVEIRAAERAQADRAAALEAFRRACRLVRVAVGIVV